jgi:hypothetical protein
LPSKNSAMISSGLGNEEGTDQACSFWAILSSFATLDRSQPWNSSAMMRLPCGGDKRRQQHPRLDSRAVPSSLMKTMFRSAR